MVADVAIVGGGMVGMTLACALGDSGLQVCVIEPRAQTPDELWLQVGEQNSNGFDARVSALSIASEQILKNLGAWPQMEALRLCPYRDMQVWETEGTAQIHFSAAELHEPHLGHIVENRVTLAGLYRAQQAWSNVHLISGASLESLSEAQPQVSGRAGSGRELLLSDGRRLNARLVVAADGAHSKVRQLAGLPVWEQDYGHHALVTTVRTTRSHQSTAWQCFTDAGPLAFLPLSSGDREGSICSIVWSTPPDHARELMALSLEQLSQRLETVFERRLGSVEVLDPLRAFPLRQRHAKRYVDDGLALVGDAAHTIHPLAGQGVNLGLLDVATLTDVILEGLSRGADFGSRQWLRRYQRQRQGSNLLMMGMMQAFRQLYGQVPPPLQWLRNEGMRQVDRFGAVKRHLVTAAMGLDGELPPLARRSF
jgi:2-octaprenylphenol hydroxylase